MNINRLKSIIKEAISAGEYYYNSFGEVSTFGELMEVEVEDRENYTKKEVQGWMKKYKITNDAIAVWVTTNLEDSEQYIVNPDDGTYAIERSAGFLIPESYDDDGGYLLIVTNPEKEFDWVEVDTEHDID